MHKYLAFAFVLLISVLGTRAQTGRISGNIIDSKTGETLPGATIFVEGTQHAASADFDGKFVINNVPEGVVTVVINYISYNAKKITGVKVSSKEVANIHVLLEPSGTQDLQEVVVVATVARENNVALVLEQKASTSISDGISAETIKRTPDRTTSDVLKRITGVTIQDNKFVVIRGLNERYNASYLNGSPLPSSEPDKRAFAFDLFPANMLDNIIVNKTATPDLPSEFAGGVVMVNTKSIPERNFLQVSAGAGYNTITTGKEKTVYQGGKLDFIGLDDGSRDLPAGFPSYEDRNTWMNTSEKEAETAKFFSNDWKSSKSVFSPNTSAQVSGGYNFKRRDKDFIGVIGSLSHNVNQNLYVFERNEYDGLLIDGSNNGNVRKERGYLNTVNHTQVISGALLNLACKVDENNSITLKNLVSASSDNRFIIAEGSNNFLEASKSINRVTSRFFSANRIISSQLIGQHYLPEERIKFNWTGSVSNIKRTVPNMRFMSYSRPEADSVYTADISPSRNTGPQYSGFRVYSRLDETIYSGKLDVSRLFKVSPNFKFELKGGGFYQLRQRQYNIRQFGLLAYQLGPIRHDQSLRFLPENEIFAEENLGQTPDGKGGFKAIEITKPDDNYNARSQLFAGYLMTELKVAEHLRVVGGARYESYYQSVVIEFLDKDSVFVENIINDLLPSLNFIYNPNELLGLRLSYYRTLNRPEFRELAVTNWYDPESRLSVAGNADLKRCFIQNADIRFEIYPGRGQLITTSVFGKYFDTPIEKYMLPASENQIYYRNANYGYLGGAELEYRVNLGAILKKDSIKFLNNLTVFSNFTYIYSEVDVAGINAHVPDKRPMQGQAPYLINAGLSYVDNENDFSISAMVNRAGERIYIVGNDIIGNRWENGRTALDIQATKSLFDDRFEARLNVKDLLAQQWIVYYKGSVRESNKYLKDVDYINFSRNYGPTCSLILSYRF